MPLNEAAGITTDGFGTTTRPILRRAIPAFAAAAALGSLLLCVGYNRVRPTATPQEVPEKIGAFMLERVAFAGGDLVSSERHFVATYVVNDGDLSRRVTYIYRRFSDPPAAMRDAKLKCSGSLEDEARVLDVSSMEIGRAAYCNSSTPFFWIILGNESRIVRADFADIPKELLKEFALHFGRPVGAYLSNEPRWACDDTFFYLRRRPQDEDKTNSIFRIICAVFRGRCAIPVYSHDS
jgi:hypothetical protein